MFVLGFAVCLAVFGFAVGFSCWFSGVCFGILCDSLSDLLGLFGWILLLFIVFITDCCCDCFVCGVLLVGVFVVGVVEVLILIVGIAFIVIV